MKGAKSLLALSLAAFVGLYVGMASADPPKKYTCPSTANDNCLGYWSKNCCESEKNTGTGKSWYGSVIATGLWFCEVNPNWDDCDPFWAVANCPTQLYAMDKGTADDCVEGQLIQFWTYCIGDFPQCR